MGTQCACQKIESEEEILSRIIGNMKIREIETKCVYYEFLNCIDSEDMIIDYFLFSNFVAKIIGNNLYYRLPQTNFFENLRKRNDYSLSNIKAIAIILILFSAGDEQTKINYIIEYFFTLYQKLNDKTVKEFLGYIIDSQTDNCIISFREIYSFESIKAFKEIYSKYRRKLLINIIFENFESVKMKYLGKILSSKKQENSFSSNSLILKKNKVKHKRKAETLINQRSSIRNKLMKAFSVHNKKNNENVNQNTSNTLLNLKKKVTFCKEKKDLNIKNFTQNLINQYCEINNIKKYSSLKNDMQTFKSNNYLKGGLKESSQFQENLKILNINATTETDKRKLKNLKSIDENQLKNNLKFLENDFQQEEIPIIKKISFKSIHKNNENLESEKNFISEEKDSAKFKSDSNKSSKVQELKKNNSDKLNEKFENINNYYNKNVEKENDIDINEISFCKKNSSQLNVFEEGLNDDKNTQKLNAINIDDKNSILEKLDDTKEKKISLENDKLNEKLGYNLDTSKVICVDRISFYSNTNNNYEKYNKGQCDKTLKNNNSLELLQKFPDINGDNTNKKIKHLYKINKIEKPPNNIVIDNETLNKEIVKDPNLNYIIFREFLELTFQFFNGDTIRNWLYDNYLREKLNHN